MIGVCKKGMRKLELHRSVLSALLALLLLWPASAMADLINTAQASYVDAFGRTQTLTSNTVVVTVTSAEASPVSSNASLSNVRVYPNPWRKDHHASKPYVVIDGLPNTTSVKIFTLSGQLAKDLGTVDSRVQWELDNDRGDRVASGIYLYLISTPDGSKQTGKIVIIR